MTNLTRFENDGIELVIDTITGEAYASIRAVSRMVSRNESTIRGFITARKYVLLDSEILTQSGLKTARLLNEEQILNCVSEYDPKLLIKFAKIGTRVFLHTMAGYEVKSTAIAAPQTFIEALEFLLESEKAKEKLKQEKFILQSEVAELSEKVDELFNYSSIIRVAKHNGVSEKLFNWRRLKAYSELKEIPIKSAPCPRYEKKNLYSHDVWMDCYPEYRLPDGDIVEGE